MKYVIVDNDNRIMVAYEGELDETSNKRSYLTCSPFAKHIETELDISDLSKLICEDGVIKQKEA